MMKKIHSIQMCHGRIYEADYNAIFDEGTDEDKYIIVRNIEGRLAQKHNKKYVATITYTYNYGNQISTLI
jgi:hypothetical protein